MGRSCPQLRYVFTMLCKERCLAPCNIKDKATVSRLGRSLLAVTATRTPFAGQHAALVQRRHQKSMVDDSAKEHFACSTCMSCDAMECGSREMAEEGSQKSQGDSLLNKCGRLGNFESACRQPKWCGKLHYRSKTWDVVQQSW